MQVDGGIYQLVSSVPLQKFAIFRLNPKLQYAPCQVWPDRLASVLAG